MVEENLIDRISEAYLNPTFLDGEVLLNTDINEIVNITKTAINANYYDIQKLQNGTTMVGNSEKFNGATLSKSIDGELANNDTTVPTSQQVKLYIDTKIGEL